MHNRKVQITPEITSLVENHAPVAIGVSGGIDSQAAAIATIKYLNSMGHKGPRLLIHCDLGSVEWKDSLPVCQRLAEKLETELIILRRRAGDMMDRWESRWKSSIRRYINLETVTLVLPWSTPAMRFCTSELKTHLIEAEIRRRWAGQTVVNVTGVRRDESKNREKGSIASLNSSRDIWSWRPCSDWTKPDAFYETIAAGLEPHEAYDAFGMSRVSCMFCIMSKWMDLVNAAAQPEALEIYLRMVELEIESTFAFQGSRWLGDVAPHLLSAETIIRLQEAKERACHRVELESSITDEMLYVKGWPTRMLTDKEAAILANVRTDICEMFGWESNYLDVPSIHGRYAELMQENEYRKRRKQHTKKKKTI